MRQVIAAIVAVSATVSAQPAQPSFDVVSITRARSIERGGGSAGLQPGGRFVMTNGPARVLLNMAYRTPTGEIFGAPGWVTYENYDVEARAGRSLQGEELSPLLRVLLADRFRLRAHLETRVRPMYELRVASTDRRLGPAMRPSTVDCQSRPGACSTQGGAGVIESNGISMRAFVTWLPARLGRPVLDRTGLTGDYALTLSWSATDTGNGPSLSTALREQLGLALQSVEAPTEVLVVDHIERPSEN